MDKLQVPKGDFDDGDGQAIIVLTEQVRGGVSERVGRRDRRRRQASAASEIDVEDDESRNENVGIRPSGKRRRKNGWKGRTIRNGVHLER
jgi:hypothetical protein